MNKIIGDITININYEALTALANLVEYASKDISPDDEPLLDELSKMLFVKKLQHKTSD